MRHTRAHVPPVPPESRERDRGAGPNAREDFIFSFTPFGKNEPPAAVRMRHALKLILRRYRLRANHVYSAASDVFRDDCTSDHLSDVPRVENAPESI